jgi:hypothetical protein
MRGGRLVGLKLVVGPILTLGNGHRAYARVQCPRASFQLGSIHRPHDRIPLRIQECLNDDLAIAGFPFRR